MSERCYQNENAWKPGSKNEPFAVSNLAMCYESAYVLVAANVSFSHKL